MHHNYFIGASRLLLIVISCSAMASIFASMR